MAVQGPESKEESAPIPLGDRLGQENGGGATVVQALVLAGLVNNHTVVQLVQELQSWCQICWLDWPCGIYVSHSWHATCEWVIH